jgi:hypothetical protein
MSTPSSRFGRIAANMHTVITAAQNAVEYPLRQLIKWRRGAPQFPNESKKRLFNHLAGDTRIEAENIEKGLRKRYHLETLRVHSTADHYRVNLFYLDMLDKAFSQDSLLLPETLHAADVGASDWFYLPGFHGFLRWWNTSTPRNIQLTGYEADAYRVYGNLFSRFDCAHAHMQGLENVHYVPKGFASQPARFHCITLFFPFVFLKDHLIWGLPRGKFKPAELLDRVLESLVSKGVLLIVNQGEKEHDAQKDLLAKRGIIPKAAFRHTSPLYHYDIPRYVLLASKDKDEAKKT